MDWLRTPFRFQTPTACTHVTHKQGRQARACLLFLSIHANASDNPRARGLETYYLNCAPNPEAERIAANPEGHGLHKYDLDSFGLSAGLITERYRDYIDRYDIPVSR